MEKVEAAYEALCYHASGEGLGMPSGWAHCEGMFGCRWGCQCRGKPGLRRLANEVPADCEGVEALRAWAKDPLQREWKGQYRRMQTTVSEWLRRYENEPATEALSEAMTMRVKVDAAYKALCYHA